MKLVSLENLLKYNELLNQKTVKSVNSVKPDSNGNVTLGTEKSTFNKVVYDTGYFSIGTAKTYNFDLTGSDLENVSKENVNIRLIAKVVTAHYGFEVGDIVQLTPAVDYTDSYGDLDVCTYIRGNTLYVYSGDAGALSIATGAAVHLQKANVQIKAVLTAFVPDDGSILLIAEDQTNTSKLIGLPDGTLTWGDKNIVRSVNGVNADEQGNAQLDGLVKSVNGATADASGNVTINTLTLKEEWHDENGNFYRVYSNGWCEQGGIKLKEEDNVIIITLFKPYINDNYCLLGNVHDDDSYDYVTFHNKTKTNFVWVSINFEGHGYPRRGSWYACGFIR